MNSPIKPSSLKRNWERHSEGQPGKRFCKTNLLVNGNVSNAIQHRTFIVVNGYPLNVYRHTNGLGGWIASKLLRMIYLIKFLPTKFSSDASVLKVMRTF
jgi:hypothetical protein